MRQKLFLLLLLTASIPALAGTPKVRGTVVDATTGAPVKGATVMLRDQGVQVVSGGSGEFFITASNTGSDGILVMVPGYEAMLVDVDLADGTADLGTIRLSPDSHTMAINSEEESLLFDMESIEDDEGASQSIAALSGASDDIFYNTASYNFGPMYFRYRGLDSQYQNVYINGIQFNDAIRGRFNFSTLLGMTSRAFRNKTTTIGLGASNYGFGGLGGSINYNTVTSGYAPGFNGSVAYTNSNYMLRAMATYSTGLNKHGWAFTVSAIGRYSKEGIVPGTFYNSAGLFLSVEKVFNKNNSLTLTAFGGPTQRANSSATYQEAYDLAGSNLYNPNWGWQDGKKRASRIIETFDPTFILNWLHKGDKTTVNTAVAARWVNYSTSALNWYKALDPNPTYYRYLPSYYKDSPEQYDLYTQLWKDGTIRQINWDNLYQINYLNNVQNQTLPDDKKKGSSYILENRHSNQFNAMFSSYVNHQLTSYMALQGGVGVNYTRGTYYKTIRDLLGGEFWIDIDPFSDREISIAPDMLQNNLDNPNRHVTKGDKFGYNYDIDVLKVNGWLQNTITLPQWDVNYGLEMSYTMFQRDGKWRNGRAPNNSLGKGQIHRFDNAMFKAGATYKINGRNFLSAHVQMGTRAPLVESVYISPRVKDTSVDNPTNERIFSGDISYAFSYRKFRGAITGFYTSMSDVIERTAFYDDRYSSFMNYVLAGVHKVNKGVEIGLAYKITPSVTATFAGTYSRYQYKNNPQGTRSYENGMKADTTQTVYLRNFYAGSTPQVVGNLGIDWQAPKNWYFNINGTWMGDAYVNLSAPYHEAMPDLWQMYPTQEQLEAKLKELSTQDKLKDAFVLNASIGKFINFRNRKMSMNINLNVNNILNNRKIATYAYQQARINTDTYDRNAFANRYSYAQGIRVYLNVGIRF